MVRVKEVLIKHLWIAIHPGNWLSLGFCRTSTFSDKRILIPSPSMLVPWVGVRRKGLAKAMEVEANIVGHLLCVLRGWAPRIGDNFWSFSCHKGIIVSVLYKRPSLGVGVAQRWVRESFCLKIPLMTWGTKDPQWRMMRRDEAPVA